MYALSTEDQFHWCNFFAICLVNLVAVVVMRDVFIISQWFMGGYDVWPRRNHSIGALFFVYKASVSLLVIVLEVLLSCCGYLPHHVQKDMLNQLVDSLSKFTVQWELIRLNVDIAIELTYHLVESKKQAAKKVRTWTGELLQVRYVNSS